MSNMGVIWGGFKSLRKLRKSAADGGMQSFRDGPKDQTSDAHRASGNLEIPGSMLRIAPE
jgi:hypothetical protein